MRHLFVVGSLDKQMQNEKEPTRLASAGVGELFCVCVESINLTWLVKFWRCIKMSSFNL